MKARENVKTLNCVLEILKMTWCVAVGCSSNYFKKNRIEGISFYQLPKDDIFFKKKEASKYQESKFTKYPSICHLNFEEVLNGS